MQQWYPKHFETLNQNHGITTDIFQYPENFKIVLKDIR